MVKKLIGDQALSGYRSARKKYNKLKRSMETPVTKEMLIEQYKKAGFKKGDILEVHSSLKSMGNVEGGPETVVAALLSVIGEEGTLMVPTYTGIEVLKESMKKGETIDLRTNRGMQGIIAETARKVPGAIRSSNPISSCTAIGPKAEYLTSGHHLAPSISHKDSPFARILELNAKVVSLGTSTAQISFYHLVEEIWPDYPFNTRVPEFEAEYINANGERVRRNVCNYKNFPHRIDNPTNQWLRDYFGDCFDRYGRHKFKNGHGSAWWIHAEDLFTALKNMASNGITIYTSKDEWVKNGSPIA